MSDIVERLRRKVFRGPTMGATHTKTVEWEAADEIERLRAALWVIMLNSHSVYATEIAHAALGKKP